MFFRYFNEEKHAQNWIKRGRLRFRPLAYYRKLEANDIRSDANDGVLRFKPRDGLELTKEDGTVVRLDGWCFEASAKEEQIFIQCFSSTYSKSLAEKFGPFCVALADVDAVIARIKGRAHPSSKIDYSQVHHGKIEYRAADVPPDVDWALPERLVLMKPANFVAEDEYRIAIGLRGAFEVHNVDLHLRGVQPDRSENLNLSASHFDIELGSLVEFAELRRF